MKICVASAANSLSPEELWDFSYTQPLLNSCGASAAHSLSPEQLWNFSCKQPLS